MLSRVLRRFSGLTIKYGEKAVTVQSVSTLVNSKEAGLSSFMAYTATGNVDKLDHGIGPGGLERLNDSQHDCA